MIANYCTVAIYLDPLKSGPPDHFCLKILDPSEIFYPPLKKLLELHSMSFEVGVQNFQLKYSIPHISSLAQQTFSPEIKGLVCVVSSTRAIFFTYLRYYVIPSIVFYLFRVINKCL